MTCMKVQKENIETLLKEYLNSRPEILFAYLFGSAGTSDSFQDIDMAIYVADMKRIGDGFEYAFTMSGELERLLGCSVDVILMNTAPDHLIHSISKGKLIVDRDEDTRVDFITSSWSRYFDFEPKRRQWLQEVIEAHGTS